MRDNFGQWFLGHGTTFGDGMLAVECICVNIDVLKLKESFKIYSPIYWHTLRQKATIFSRTRNNSWLLEMPSVYLFVYKQSILYRKKSEIIDFQNLEKFLFTVLCAEE